MGQRGPIPKRSDQRVRRNEDPDLDKVTVPGADVRIPEPDDAWHPIATEWYESLSSSGQSMFFEPSDWAAARYVATVMTKNLEDERFNASLFSSVWSAMTDLLTTEGARRRVRVEIERSENESESQADVWVLDQFRRITETSNS